MSRIAVVSVLCGALAACSDASVDDFASGAPVVFDKEGRKWEFMGRMDRKQELAPRKTRERVPNDQLSDRELGELYRPMLFVDEFEYLLADEHLEELGARLREPVPESEMGGGPEGTDPETFLSGVNPYADPRVLVPQDGQVVDGQSDKYKFGTDNRLSAAAFSHQYPWRTIGHMTIVDNGNPWGTLFKVHNNATAVTAAHCLRKDGVTLAAARFQFGARTSPDPVYPESPAPLPTKRCYAYTIPTAWDVYGDTEFDYAVIRLNYNCPLASYNTGYLGLRNTSAGQQYIIGYPANGSGSFDGPPPGVAVGNPVFHWGTVHNNSGGLLLGTDNIDSSTGQSGGPFVLIEQQPNGEYWWFVTGVHAAWYWYFFDYENEGPSMNTEVRNFIALHGG